MATEDPLIDVAQRLRSGLRAAKDAAKQLHRWNEDEYATALAEAAGLPSLTRHAVKQWISGQSNPSGRAVLAAADLAGVSLNALFRPVSQLELPLEIPARERNPRFVRYRGLPGVGAEVDLEDPENPDFLRCHVTRVVLFAADARSYARAAGAPFDDRQPTAVVTGRWLLVVRVNGVDCFAVSGGNVVLYFDHLNALDEFDTSDLQIFEQPQKAYAYLALAQPGAECADLATLREKVPIAEVFDRS